MCSAIVGIDSAAGRLADAAEARFRWRLVQAKNGKKRRDGAAMIAGLNASELGELALLLVAVGALSGFLAGVFGIGGGAGVVPGFYELFPIRGETHRVRR